MLDENKFDELLTLTRDNNKILRDIWNFLYQGIPNDDSKDFLMNIIANILANKLEK